MAPVLSAVIVYMLLIWPCSGDNIALNKPAYQIGKWGGVAAAERAVDGQYDVDNGTKDYYLSVCARPDTAWHDHVPAEWWVDLEDVYNISTITVYNTYDKEGYPKLSNFTVDVFKSDNRTSQRCGVYNGSEPVSRGGSFTFNCDSLPGRYVYIRKLEGQDQTNIPLCEVEVYGLLVNGSTTTLQPGVTASSEDRSTATETATYSTTTTMTTEMPQPSPSTSEPPPTTTLKPTTTETITIKVTPTMATITPTTTETTSQTPTTTETTTSQTSTTTETTTSQTPTTTETTINQTPTTIVTSSPTISQNTPLGPLIDIPLRGKPTNQTGAFAGLTSDRAVDGLLYNSGGGDDNAHCAHPLNEADQPAEWWIDLEEMYKIHSITLYNTGNAGGYFRMADFAIRVYSRRVQSNVTCAEYPGQVGSAANITLTCRHNTYGQYVQFIRLGDGEINKVTICEVKIKGQTYSGCPLGYYGDQCNQLCGMCSNEDPDIYNPCDVTGSCVNGCQMWWITESCKTEIVKLHYDGQQVSLNMSTSDEIDIFLQQVNVPSNISQYYGYNVTYDNDSFLVNHDHSKTTIIVTLTGLNYNTEYLVKVQPYRVMRGQYDYGETYPEKVFKTRCAVPDPPIFSPNPRNSSSDTDGFEIMVNYEVPKEIRCDALTSLQVSYHSDANTTWTSVNAEVNLDTLNITSLDPGTYFIKMTATNNQGLSAESETKSIVIKAAPAVRRTYNRNVTTTASAVVVSLLVITAVVIAVVLLYIRKFKKNKESHKTDEANNASSPGPFTSSDGDGFDGIIVDKTSEATLSGVAYKEEENPYMNTVICISDFEDYVKMKNANSSNQFDEYKSLPPINHERYKIAITDDNKKKNRYLNIYPYDDNRVILEEEYSNTGGDYINASFIKGYDNTEKAYIATQGVKPETVHHFWKMIWQYNINRIVMLSNLVEENKRKCHQYWPKTTGEPEYYKDYSVACDSETEFADFVVRVLLLTKGDESRQVYHFHFTSWKDKSRPMLGPFTLANFHRKVHSMDSEGTGPLVVHCSAGVGRTGTFIAFDILLQQKTHERVVDIYGCIEKLRQQRMLMVQTKDQYIFLHDAVLEAILIGETSYPCSTLSEEVKSIYEENGNRQSELERQFMLLGKLKNKQSNKLKEGLLDENKHKNRLPDVVPDECDRPYLSTPAAGSNHYINAVYVDSFRKHCYYVVTQMPLPDTEVDFWRLVYDQRLKCIVMLNELDEADQTCKQYWPDEGNADYGPIKVQLLASAKISPDIAMKEFVVDLAEKEDNSRNTSSKPLNVRHYHLLNWPNTDVIPPDNSAFLSLMEEIHRWIEQEKHSQGANENHRILIHCLDGVTRSGMFCGASHAIEQMKMNNEVDIFLAARYVSLRRQQFFQTLEEYKFLYDIAVEYLARYNQYVNFSGPT